MKDKAYFLGVMLGDGFVTKRKNGYYCCLKVIDPDFVETWRDCAERLWGKKYSIYSLKKESKKRQKCYICKVYGKDKVEEVEKLTHNKTEIPNFVYDGNNEVKKAFIQGLMDSEGYVKCCLRAMGCSDMGIHFASTSNYTKDLRHMFDTLKIEVSKLYRRKMKDGRKDVLNFRINPIDYLKNGLTFNIERKKRRLEFISKILNDYTCNYKGANYKKALSR